MLGSHALGRDELHCLDSYFAGLCYLPRFFKKLCDRSSWILSVCNVLAAHVLHPDAFGRCSTPAVKVGHPGA